MLLFSCASMKMENKIIGSWKIEKVIHSNGKIEKGYKTLIFYNDKTVLSTNQNSDSIKGKWEFAPKTKELKIFNYTKEKWEKFEVLKLTKKEFIVTDQYKTAEAIRIKTLKNE